MSCSHLEHVQTDNVHLETIQLNDLLHGVIYFREGNFYQILNLANGKFLKLDSHYQLEIIGMLHENFP